MTIYIGQWFSLLLWKGLTYVVVWSKSVTTPDGRSQVLIVSDGIGVVIRDSLVEEDAMHGEGGFSTGWWPCGVGLDILFDFGDVSSSFLSAHIAEDQCITVGCESGDCGEEVRIGGSVWARAIIGIDDDGELDIGIGNDPIRSVNLISAILR